MFWPFSSSQSVFPMKLTHLTQAEMAESNRAYVCIWRGIPGGTSGKEPTRQRRGHKRCGFDPWEMQVQSLVWEDPQRRAWQPTPAFLSGESHGQKSLMGYSPCGRKESDMTEAT